MLLLFFGFYFTLWFEFKFMFLNLHIQKLNLKPVWNLDVSFYHISFNAATSQIEASPLQLLDVKGQKKKLLERKTEATFLFCISAADIF